MLLEECVDRRLATDIAGHEVTTSPDEGRAGLTNGELLSRAQRQFDALITIDRRLPFQQNLARIVDDVITVIKGSIELWPTLVEISYLQKGRHGLPMRRVRNGKA